MLFFHLLLLWSGVLLLYYSNINNKYRFLYFVLPWIPGVLSQSGMIWKDISFSLGAFFIFTTFVFYIYKNKTASFYVILGLLLLCFYVTNAKFQAIFLLPIIIWMILSISYIEDQLLVKFIVCILLCFVIYSSNITINNKLATNTQSQQLRQIFDLAGISVNIDSDEVMPAYVKSAPIYNFEKLKKILHS